MFKITLNERIHSLRLKIGTCKFTTKTYRNKNILTVKPYSTG